MATLAIGGDGAWIGAANPGALGAAVRILHFGLDRDAPEDKLRQASGLSPHMWKRYHGEVMECVSRLGGD